MKCICEKINCPHVTPSSNFVNYRRCKLMNKKKHSPDLICGSGSKDFIITAIKYLSTDASFTHCNFVKNHCPNKDKLLTLYDLVNL